MELRLGFLIIGRTFLIILGELSKHFIGGLFVFHLFLGGFVGLFLFVIHPSPLKESINKYSNVFHKGFVALIFLVK